MTPEATNLRRFLKRVSEGLNAQAEGLRSLLENDNADEAVSLDTYAKWLSDVADNVRYDGTVDWAELEQSMMAVRIMVDPTLPMLVTRLASAVDELEARVDNPPEDDTLANTVRELETRIDDLEG